MKPRLHVSAPLAVAIVLLASMAAAQSPATTTPIQHLVVIFQENNSFDHYFGTYPKALYPNGVAATTQNPYGESPFVPLPNTPSINGLTPAPMG